MTVRTLLNAMPDRKLVALPSMQSVFAVCTLMAQERVGAILVVDSDILFDIFTERDLTIRVVARRLNPRLTFPPEVATKQPQTVRAYATTGDALRPMRLGHYRHLPAIDEGHLIGIVSTRNLAESVTPDFGRRATRSGLPGDRDQRRT